MSRQVADDRCLEQVLNDYLMMLTRITANEADMDDGLVAGVITMESTQKKDVGLTVSFGHCLSLIEQQQ